LILESLFTLIGSVPADDQVPPVTGVGGSARNEPQRVFSNCGSKLAADEPQALCSVCLLKIGLVPLLEDSVAAGGDCGPVDPTEIPSKFGDFEIAHCEDGSIWELGRGGMGVTYRARDNVLHRSVALKVIEVPSGAANSEAVRERFLREARAAGALRHPNVAAVYQFGTVPELDRCYYAMELVEGETLEAQVRREGPLKVGQVLEIGEQVTRALIAAAHQGLIHRDLKPGNIMLTRSEDSSVGFEVKVIDFGLAKVTAESFGEKDLTHGGFVGTPSYASPEQFAGSKLDVRSDIYSLGASLWFALTGHRPHAGTNVEEIRRSQTELPLPVQQLLARKVPAPVTELLRTMLAVDPDERPASPRELMEEIASCRSKLTDGNERTRGSFLAELKRRNVYKVAVAYAVIAWLLIQASSIMFPTFEAPSWVMKVFITIVAAGFPISLILAWAFELTPQGIKRTETVDREAAEPSRKKLWVYVVIIAAALSLGLFFVGRYTAPTARVASESPAKSIAVLPFENLSRDPDNAYFADGTQNEILTKLAGVGDLKVISRTSSAKYKSKPEDLKTVARELGVATVLEGSVQRAGDKVRINVQLLDARSDTHLWAKSYDRNFNDIFAVESDIAQEIADTLRAKNSPSQANALAAAPTRDTEAYDLFLKGEYQERQAESTYKGEIYDRAATLYLQGLTWDPSFALAYARLAYNRLFRHWYVKRLTSTQLEEVKSDAERALGIAPDSPEAHLAMGLFHYWGRHDFGPALREFDRAIELQPNNSVSREFRAAIHRRRGEWRRSLAEFERGMELDPRDVWKADNIGSTYLVLRRWSDAEHWLKHALALDPHHVGAAYRLDLTYIGSSGDIQRARQAWEGIPEERGRITVGAYEIVIAQMIEERVYLDVLERQFSEALKAWEIPAANTAEARLVQLEARIGIQVLAGQNVAAKPECEEALPLLEAELAKRRPEDHTSVSELAWIYVCLGRNADALRIAREAAESMPIEKDAILGVNFLVGLAQIEAHTGQSEQAVKLLRQLLTMPAGEYISVARLKIDPVWDPIRGDPGFQKLLSEPEPETIYK